MLRTNWRFAEILPACPDSIRILSNCREHHWSWDRAGAVAVAAGSELCSPPLVRAGRFEVINRKAAEFIQAVDKAR